MAVPDADSIHDQGVGDEYSAKDRSKPKSSSSKSKDLSHVPCKFYRVGSCTAGLSCPFSHSPPASRTPHDPNNPNANTPQPKDVCAWFVKGTCKFGHKCALAHVLPGQSMAMDRKNKKAAQAAAAAANPQGAQGGSGGGRGKGNRGQRDHHSQAGGGPGSTANANSPSARSSSNPLLSGSTAPTRSVHPLPLSSSKQSSIEPSHTLSSSSNLPPDTSSSSSTATSTTAGPASRLQMPSLKATISPSAPAPPLKDTDFANFTIGMDVEDITTGKLPSAPALPSHTQSMFAPDAEDERIDTENPQPEDKPPPPATTSPLPTTAPRRTHHSRPSHDFGPIGSPPRSSPHTQNHMNLNGFSPGTSPPHEWAGAGGRSPFSAPNQGTQSIFLHPSGAGGASSPPGTGMDFKLRSGLAASLGTAHLSAMGGGRTRSGSGTGLGSGAGGGTGWSTDYGPVPSQVLSASVSHAHTNLREREKDVALEDEDLEEFIPGSLSDLLTPSERSRRMSRTNSGQQSQQPGRPALSTHHSNSGLGIGLHEGGNGGSRHHYSRSVPAPSLLGDLRSIWASNGSPHPHPSQTTAHTTSNLGGIGTPSSFKSNNNAFGALGGGGGGGGGEGLSASYNDRESSMLSPTNASAAFLGGLHHHYLNRGNSNTSSSGERTRLHAHSNFSGAGGGSNDGGLNVNGSALGMGAGTAFSPPRLNAFGSRPPFSTHDSHPHIHTSSQAHLSQELTLNGISSRTSSTTTTTQSGGFHQPTDAYLTNTTNTNTTNPHLNPQQQTTALSPSTRALQSHAPGQSLPQGLAAGYSRIHALPPPPNMGPSPSFSGVGSPGSGSGSPGTGGLEWLSLGPKTSPAPDSSAGGGNGGTGLESMFSRLSYSAAATRPTQPSTLSLTAASANSNNPTASQTGAPTMARNPSGGKPWQSGSGASGGGGPLSPLSGPVLTGDDDDLFSMDG